MDNEIQVSFQQQLKQAELFIKSGFLPKAIDSPEKAVMIMQTGKDLGLSATEALRSISIIQGVPTMKAQLMLGLCYKTREVLDCKIVEEKGKCSVTLTRKGMSPFTAIFTMEDAKALQLDRRDNWIKQPATMLRWRALSQACRIVFPDAISGLYTEEEIADEIIIDKQGNVEVVEKPRPEPPALECKPTGQELKSEDVPDEELENWIMPSGKYKDKTLKEVVLIMDGGNLTGASYLQYLADNAQTQAYKNVISRFLAKCENEGILPPPEEKRAR